MIKEDSELDYSHEIQQIFRYHYRNEWVSQAFINQHNRLWIKTFNKLLEQGFIERKKTVDGFVYRWNTVYPDL